MATRRSGETYREPVAEMQNVLTAHSSSTLGPSEDDQ